MLGLDAAFLQASYAPGDAMTMFVAADAHALTVQLFQSGPETVPTYANNLMNGVPVGDPLQIDWHLNVDGPAPINLTLDPTLPSGVYYARLQSSDGRIGYAPFIVRPPRAQHRVAVIMPTNTWQAYNFYDADGDGFGDSWYVSWATDAVDVTRPHLNRGVPVQVPQLRPLVPALDVAHRQAGGLLRRRGSRGVPRAATRCASAYDLVDLPRSRGVRRGARLRRRPALPRSRREPDVPVGEQLLPARRPARDRA